MAIYTTYADILRPQEQQKSWAYDALLVLGGSLLIAASAQLAIHVPFSPVPITGQTFAVIFLAALFGSRRGAATVLAYLAEGAAGMPVFAGGTGGLPVFAGPTAGYLLGFIVAAFVVGMLAERGWDRRVGTTIAAMIAGNAIIYLFGVIWLSTLLGLSGAITAGLTPFLIGDVMKITLAAALLPTGWKLLSDRSSK